MAFQISKKYAERRAWYMSALSYLQDEAGGPTPAATRLLITLEWIVAFSVIYTRWDSVWQLYNDPTKQSSLVIAQMKDVDDELWEMYIGMRRQVQNGQPVQTREDREALGTPERQPKTPVTIPDESVVPTLVENKRGAITVRAARIGPEAGQLTNPDNTRLIIMICLLDIGMPEPEITSYELYRTSSRNREVLHFTPGQIGKAVWVVMAFTNSAGRGPWSRAVRFIVT